MQNFLLSHCVVIMESIFSKKSKSTNVNDLPPTPNNEFLQFRVAHLRDMLWKAADLQATPY